jgi:hypothetical protein
MGKSDKSRFADSLAVMRKARETEPTLSAPAVVSTEQPAPRAKGKKSDPAYTQCNGYIPRELYKRVRLALIEDERELGELMTVLLQSWLDARERKD